jgi:hypothetical protein
VPCALPARFRAIATVAAFSFAGCASSSVQGDASAFVSQHVIAAVRAAVTTRAVEVEVSQLSSSPTGPQLERLARAAGKDRRNLVLAGEWNGVGAREEGAEEEDVPRAEAQVTNGANELARAMSVLQAYARAPSAAVLTRYEIQLNHGREAWDEGISELWHLGHESNSPTI